MTGQYIVPIIAIIYCVTNLVSMGLELSFTGRKNRRRWMNMINMERKYSDKAIIEPDRVIEERKNIGLHPSCPVPAGAII